MVDKKPEEGAVQVKLVWSLPDDMPIVLANHFSISHNPPNEFLLTVGQLQLPILSGSPEEMKAQAEQLQHVAIRVMGRYAMTRDGVEKLHGVLSQHLAGLDAADAGAGDGDADR